MIDEHITILDFETTGFSGANDRVIEIAAVKVFRGEIVGQFEALIKFDGVLPPEITELTGIKPEDLEEAFDEETAFRILNKFIGNGLIVAHNAPFDLWFLHSALMRLAGRSFTNPILDTLTISRARYPYPHKLADMCKRFNITLNGAHRAFNDVLATFELLKELHEEKPVDEFVNTLGYIKKYGPPKWAPEYANLIVQ